MELNSNMDENNNKSVHDRLLDSAEQLFCERGFESTSIRDIAALADCNIASVNYYFGGKQQLYEQVWRRHLIPLRDSRIASIQKVMAQSQNNLRLEDLLRSFAEAFVGTMNTQKSSRLNKLMAREYIDNHLPVNMFVDEVMTPPVEAMQKALLQTYPDLDEPKIPFLIFSLIGQLVHLVHVRAMFENIEDNPLRKMFYSNEVIEHIVNFSSAGIRAYIKEKE